MIRPFAEIYADMTTNTGDRFTILELLKIFDKEKYWVGTDQQTLKCGSLALEITGIRAGSCSGCMINALKDLVRWVNNHEANILIQKIEQPKRKVK